MSMTAIRKKKLLHTTILIFCLFLMLSAFWNGQMFPSDEAEIFLKGRAIAKGVALYSEIGSQHMPLMYYIAAVFALFGAESVAAFRLYFYFLMAALWGLCYYRYSDKLNKRALVLYPIIYIVLMAYISMGHAILSEQMYGIGMAILLFELLIFQQERELKTGNCMMISLAVFVSFGSAFVAVFGIFAVVLTVLGLEIHTCLDNKTSFGKSLQYLIGKYWKLILIVLFPFVVLFGYYAVTGTFDDFFGWAYTLNREVYPKYQPTGYGGNILSSMFNGISTLAVTLRTANINAGTVPYLVIIFLGILFLFHQHSIKKDLVLTAGLVFFFITTATRGVFEFHGLPAVSLLSAMAAMYLTENSEWIHNVSTKTNLSKATAILCVLFFAAPYLEVSTNIFEITLEDTPDEGSVADAIVKLTDAGDEIGYGTMNYDILMAADVFPANVTSGSCPWLWEWAGEQAMQELHDDPPKIYYIEPALATWEYPMAEYAHEQIQFVDENYTSLELMGYPTIYVQNEYLMEAIQQIDKSLVFRSNNAVEPLPLFNGKVYAQSISVTEDKLISSLNVLVGTFARVNSCTIDVTLIDKTIGKTVNLAQINCTNLQDNSFNEINFSPQLLKAGHIYEIGFSSPDATDANFIALYHDAEAELGEACYALENAEPKSFDLCMEIFTDDSLIFVPGEAAGVTVLWNTSSVSQTFCATENSEFGKIRIKLGTYDKQNTCTLQIALTDETTGVKTELIQVDCSTFQNNSYNDIVFEGIELTADHTYTLSFESPDASEDNKIAIYCDESTLSSTSYATIGQEKQAFNLCVELYKK